MRVGLVQMCSGREPERNLADATALIREAASQGAQFIATPETCNIMDEDLERVRAKVGLEAEDQHVKAYGQLAQELGVNLLAGSLTLLGESGKLANRSILFGPNGAIQARYDKIHLFDVQLGGGETYRESDRYQGGDQAVLADLSGVKLGLSICYDVRFGALHRELALAGADMISVPAAFTKITGEAHWHVLLRARAIETGCFILAPAQAGLHENGRETFGHSVIINPWGEVIAERAEGPGIVLADLDISEVAKARGRVPSLQHSKEFRIDPL